MQSYYGCLIVLLVTTFAIVVQSRAPSLGEASTCTSKRKTLWFMAVQSAKKESDAGYYAYVLAALKSAQHFAPSLAPVLLHSGSELNIPKAVRDIPNIRFVSHNLTFYSQITKCLGTKTSLGIWYRLDIPHIVRTIFSDLDRDSYNLDNVLYTDTDVLFFSDFNECSLPTPKVLYIGPEVLRGRQDNSGVLYMNVSAMQEHWPNVLKLAVEKCFKFLSQDQTLILDYYNGGKLSTLLPDRFNWKGYWGGADDVVIAHFHGPKPGKCLDCFQNYRKNYKTYCTHCGVNYPRLYGMVPDGGEFYEHMEFAFRNASKDFHV